MFDDAANCLNYKRDNLRYPSDLDWRGHRAQIEALIPSAKPMVDGKRKRRCARSC